MQSGIHLQKARVSISDSTEPVGHERNEYLALCESIFDLVNLDLTEAFDLQEVATSSCMDGCDGVVSVGFQLCDIDCTDAMRLDGVNVDDEAILRIVSRMNPTVTSCKVERDGSR